MNSDIEKLLSAVQSGKLSEDEMQDIGNLLLQGLSPQQNELLRQVTSSPSSLDAFMNSPEVKNFLNNQ